MATVTRTLATMDDERIKVELVYDDASLLITTLRLTNTGTFGRMTASLLDPSTRAVVFGPVTRGFGTGTFSQDITGQNRHMRTFTDSHGISRVAAPFDLSLDWSSV